MTFALPIKFCPLVNFTKIFLRKAKLFFSFLLLSLAVLYLRHYFPMLQTLKLNTENQKTEKKKFSSLTPVVNFTNNLHAAFLNKSFASIFFKLAF